MVSCIFIRFIPALKRKVFSSYFRKPHDRARRSAHDVRGRSIVLAPSGRCARSRLVGSHGRKLAGLSGLFLTRSRGERE